jgi:hypothetical protein
LEIPLPTFAVEQLVRGFDLQVLLAAKAAPVLAREWQQDVVVRSHRSPAAAVLHSVVLRVQSQLTQMDQVRWKQRCLGMDLRGPSCAALSRLLQSFEVARLHQQLQSAASAIALWLKALSSAVIAVHATGKSR